MLVRFRIRIGSGKFKIQNKIKWLPTQEPEFYGKRIFKRARGEREIEIESERVSLTQNGVRGRRFDR